MINSGGGGAEGLGEWCEGTVRADRAGKGHLRTIRRRPRECVVGSSVPYAEIPQQVHVRRGVGLGGWPLQAGEWTWIRRRPFVEEGGKVLGHSLGGQA